ncbi:MAG: PHP domain-containing protein [Sphaerochaetaceae bacterium]
MLVRIDLHNHSCLSPCGNDDLTPALLAVEAMEQKIDILALTDHNCGRNLPAFAEACELCGIVGVYGMEVNTIEDVHVLALFAHLDDAMDFSSFIEYLLPDIPNRPDLFGNQLIVDIEGKTTGVFEKSLFSTSGISFSDLIEEVLSRDGLVIPAHIDRPSNSAVANLGFLPDLPYSAVEAVKVPTEHEVWGKTVIQGSDAHFLSHVGKRNCRLEVPQRSFQGLKQGLSEGIVVYGP